MDSLSFEYPKEFILVCLAIGFIYAFIMYSKSAPWPVWVNRGLFAVRTIIAAILLILLLSPVLRQIQNTTEPPQLVIAVDNSLSVKAMYDSIQLEELNNAIARMQREFNTMGYSTVLVSENEISEDQRTFSFNLERTNLDALLQDIRNDFEGRNLPEVLLLSDGIVNSGVLPTYRNYPFNLTTIGLGDSTPRYDISIEELTYNKIAYQGNKFVIRARISQYGFDNQTVPVTVYHRGKAVVREEVSFDGIGVREIDLVLDADENGVQRYSVQIPVSEREFIEENNSSDAYIEVIEGKQKLTIVAAAPHPDLSALTEILEKNQNYEIQQFILSIPEERAAFGVYNDPTDLFILHQLPSAQVAIDWGERFGEQSALMIYGPQTDMQLLLRLFPGVGVESYPGEFDKVSGVVNPGYAPFTYSDELQAMLNEFPPLITPFGDFTMSGESDVLLTQRVGSISTSKPLLLTQESDAFKKGLFLGSGLWQWKLTDYARNKNNRLFEEFLTNLVQYLTTRADKRKFRFYPIRQEYNTGQEVVFQAELYNDLYERVYGNKVDIRLRNNGEEQTFTYVTSEENSRYIVNGLEEGVYEYIATTEFNGTTESIRGEFVVRDLELETIRLTADVGLLRELAERNGGKFYPYEQVNTLVQEFGRKEAQGTIYSQERFLPAINLLWIFILLLTLVTLEWGIRKYYGSY